ncbi:aromatic ring-hydroxylating oxygenase subunit alpha [Nocardioides antri]|uniref:Aromatic ring-hydroxylating dioxygenase subunit alpha n=1 Tax=Nocardioides antri TaxID=2607659 RepID=A0A5B1M2B0_9ACTN|nr:aromatic ring-hydroxylating dioxygenase subunit alpha [Nocardioides antri]KAA1426588.1 aromatic ring-hydroxylating dioxygenase subunit alpha [Nocardioides antri]
MPTPPCTDPVVLNLWHPLSAVAETAAGQDHTTTLLEEQIGYAWSPDAGARAWRTGATQHQLPTLVRYGYIWTSLGTPPKDLFSIPEYDEPDRRNMNASTIGVHVSAPRAIENFLDMAHFPFVHTDVLGSEPHTEVVEYDVDVSAERDEVLATRCRMFQPKASASSSAGAEVEYVYRVPHPYCSILYKTSGDDPGRKDVIAVFLQPVDQEHVRAHLLLSVLDDAHEDKEIRNFQQSIFGQDKPILENQFPKRLPLDPRSETPIRADKSAVAYRRWLSGKGITYGVIPAGR